jgi:hypothetical protein
MGVTGHRCGPLRIRTSRMTVYQGRWCRSQACGGRLGSGAGRAAALCCCTEFNAQNFQSRSGRRRLRTPPERDYGARTTAHSRAIHRFGYLGSRVRPEAAPAPRRPHKSRHQLGSTPGSCGRGRPWCERSRRQRRWGCPRHVTILMAHRKPCGVDAHFLPLTFKGQLALASLAPSGPFWPGARLLLHFAAAPRSKTAGSNQSEPRTCVELRGLEPLASCMPSAGSPSTAVHPRRSAS